MQWRGRVELLAFRLYLHRQYFGHGFRGGGRKRAISNRFAHTNLIHHCLLSSLRSPRGVEVKNAVRACGETKCILVVIQDSRFGVEE